MNDQASGKKHWSFWLVCILALLWNIGGSVNYLMQTSLEFVNSMPATHQAIIIDRPVWATGGFALGVFGGIVGCILLLLGHRLSINVFLISLMGIIITMIHTVNVAISVIEFNVFEIFMMIVMPLVVAVALLAYSKSALRKYGR